MNEAEGSILAGQINKDLCIDLTHLHWPGPGWSGADITIKKILLLHNWLDNTIHTFYPKGDICIGIHQMQEVKGDDPVHTTGLNHYSDGCSNIAGGSSK